MTKVAKPTLTKPMTKFEWSLEPAFRPCCHPRAATSTMTRTTRSSVAAGLFRANDEAQHIADGDKLHDHSCRGDGDLADAAEA